MLSSLSDFHTLAIATGRPAAEAIYPIKENKIDFFEKILTLDDCGKAEKEAEKNRCCSSTKISFGKPHPFMLDVIAEYFESRGALSNGAKLYYIGDMPDYMIAAKRSKYSFCATGVTYSAPDKEVSISRLKEAGADKIINSPQELIEYLKT